MKTKGNLARIKGEAANPPCASRQVPALASELLAREELLRLQPTAGFLLGSEALPRISRTPSSIKGLQEGFWVGRARF